MSKSTAIDELAFLEHTFPQLHLCQPERYSKARWLKCEFDALVWLCVFGDKSFEIDWRVTVGTSPDLLTSKTHLQLWTILRCWLVLSTHPDSTGGRMINTDTERRKFSVCRDWIDYFLLNADALGLPEYGLATVVSDDVISALCRIGSTSRKSTGIYRWPERLESLLRTKPYSMSSTELAALIERHPFLGSDIPDPADRLTSMTNEEIVRARAWLWAQGLYRRVSKAEYRWTVPSRILASMAYECVIQKDCHHPVAREIGLVPIEAYMREFPAAPVKEDADARMSRERLSEYRQCLSKLGVLSVVGLKVPVDAIRAVNDPVAIASLDLKQNGRFRTLPAQVVFKALRCAIEFSLQHSEDLVTSYLAVAKAAGTAKLSIDAYTQFADIRQHLRPSILALGIGQWRIGRGHGELQGSIAATRQDDYYRKFRANEGLWELLRVLYGAVQITVGTLMARRVRELTGLVAGSCLDKDGEYLIFELGKSGALDQRETEAKPIPPVAARFIREIERLQGGLLELGLIESRQSLFSYPCGAGNNVLSEDYEVYFSNTNDYFCDYFELPVDGEGRRYYIRQHQLRRFFAMLFFWSNSFGGLETLRDFLGHTNAEHVYNYITECTPGVLLRSVQAEWASEAVKTQWEAANELADLVAEHFQTRNFRVLRDDELAEYIEGLLEDGLVTIAPEFLDEGRQYRVLIKVSPKDSK